MPKRLTGWRRRWRRWTISACHWLAHSHLQVREKKGVVDRRRYFNEELLGQKAGQAGALGSSRAELRLTRRFSAVPPAPPRPPPSPGRCSRPGLGHSLAELAAAGAAVPMGRPQGRL